MKKITFFRSVLNAIAFTETSFRKTILLAIFSFAGLSMAMATQYCHTPITANDGVTVVYLTCQSPAAGQYEIKIEADVDMEGLGGSFANVNGVSGYQLNASGNFTLSSDKRTITIPITSTSAPSLYTPLYLLMPGEKVFAWPADVEWGTCSGDTDTEAPTAFTATKGKVLSTSVELLLNATDNSGSVQYKISYGAGPTVVNTTGTSGAQKSFVVSGLTASTEYTFSVEAKDAAGNTAANNPQIVTATTTENTNTECAGTETQIVDGTPLLNGYNYKFTTSGTDVSIEFELLDVKTGLVAYLWNRTSGFVETSMTNAGGQKYTLTLPGQTNGATITVACKFAYAGGMSVTKDFTYTVGNECSGSTPPVGLQTIDFETVGQDWTWTIFENGDNAASLYSVAANPSATGINTSAHSAKYTVNSNGQPWAGLWSADMPDITFTEDNCIVKVMVYKDVVSDFLVKFENDGAYATEKKLANTLVNQWEELVFDFSSEIGSSVTKLVIIPDFPNARTAGSTNYWDNISFNKKEGPVVPTEPTVAAPNPILEANKVISLFSNAYSNVTVDTWRTDWSNAGFENVSIAGNATLKFTSLVFVGAETTSNTVDATAMTHLHLDVWTPDMTTFKVKLVDFGANGIWAGGDDVEHELSFNPTTSEWNSLNIPLSSFSGLSTRAHLAQYIFSGSPAGKVYIDNVYFYDGTPTGLNDVEKGNKISLYPNPVKDMLTIAAQSDITEVVVRNLVGQTVMNVSVNGFEKSVDLSNVAAGNYFVTVKMANGQVSTQKFVKQ